MKYQWVTRIRERYGSELVRYGQVLAIIAAAVVARWFLEPVLEDAGFSIFLAAMLMGAWVGGLGPSLLGQTLLLVVHATVFGHADRMAEQSPTRAFIGLFVYYLVGTVVAVLSGARRAGLTRMAEQNDRIARQQRELDATISCIGDAVMVTDHSGRISLMNPAAEALTGWRLSEALGHPLELLFQISDDAGRMSGDLPVAHVLQTGVGVREGGIVMLSTRAARQVPVTYNATPICTPGAGVTGAVLVVRDESDRRRAEEQLLDLNRRKDDFLATLAHELRNPLAPIRNGLDLLKMAQGDPQVAAEVHSIMDRQVRHLIRLVDDLLDVSRISRGKLELRKTPTSLADVAKNAVQTIQPFLDQAQHQLVLCVPADLTEVDADPDRLTQIACNLLHNAVKFTPSGGRIELRIERDEGETRLIVDDNGPGIHPDRLHSIFEMFNQGAEEKERGKSGLGIGLNLARRLAEMHGGTVDAQSAGINQGSTFRLRLPVRMRSSTSPVDIDQPQTPTQLMPGDCRVLVVDDNADALRTIALMLESLGHETCTAKDGLEALKIAEKSRPEVILMDLGMPVLNGYETAKRLREMPWGKDIHLIALTGWGQEKDRQRTQEAGFDDHLVKPVALEALQCCLKKHRSLAARQTVQNTVEV